MGGRDPFAGSLPPTQTHCPGMNTSSSRRLTARPSRVSLLASGAASPYHCRVMRSLATPQRLWRYLAALLARRSGQPHVVFVGAGPVGEAGDVERAVGVVLHGDADGVEHRLGLGLDVGLVEVEVDGLDVGLDDHHLLHDDHGRRGRDRGGGHDGAEFAGADGTGRRSRRARSWSRS